MNQHYVPRVYLKNFARKKGTDYYVHVYDKIKDRYFETNIKNICSETNLYTLDENNEVAKHVLTVEKIYSDFLEPIYAKAYRILTNEKIFYLNDLERVEILVGLFQFYYRNPNIFRESVEIHLKNIETLYKESISKGKRGLTYLEEDFSFSEYTLEKTQNYITNLLLKTFKEQHIIATSELGSFHEFTVIEVEKIMDDSANFLTNDNPLFFQDILSQTKNPFLKSTEFIIPLDKKHVVKIYHDNQKKMNFIYRCRTLNGNVTLMNDDIYEKSTRFVIGDKETFENLNKMKGLLDDTSLELKIRIIEQILKNPALRNESKEGTEILERYYNKYLENNTLSDQDQYELILDIQKVNKKTKQGKII